MVKVLIVHLTTKQSIKANLVCRPNVGDIFPLAKLSNKVVNVVFATGLAVQSIPDLAGCDLLVYVD